ncbi:hypothetical protein ACHQM5_003837 [Ranunculus cassubicifolius]
MGANGKRVHLPFLNTWLSWQLGSLSLSCVHFFFVEPRMKPKHMHHILASTTSTYLTSATTIYLSMISGLER